jgi:aryl-alcohol dehydrogenase-like predicted oxidoreductase
VQTEFSLWSRDPQDNGVLDTVRELGIGFVPYSPLGRGFLTGAIRSPADFDADDYRRQSPRFQGDNFHRNLSLVDAVTAMARAKGITPGQLALAWVLAQGDDLVPIPGTKRIAYLEENLGALQVQLSAAELAQIDAIFPANAAAGQRYAAAAMAILNR